MKSKIESLISGEIKRIDLWLAEDEKQSERIDSLDEGYSSSELIGVGKFIKASADSNDYHLIGLAQTLIDKTSIVQSKEFESFDYLYDNDEYLFENKTKINATDIANKLNFSSAVKVNKFMQAHGIIHKVDESPFGWKLDESYNTFGKQHGLTDGTKGWIEWNKTIIELLELFMETMGSSAN